MKTLPTIETNVHRVLSRGVVIPAHPLALTAARQLDERRQRALTRYYIAAGVGGLALGVHTTQFAIRDAKVGLFRSVLQLAAEEMDRADRTRTEPLVRVGGICGDTPQAAKEAQLLRELGYHAGLLNLGALKSAGDDALIRHCRAVAEEIPIVGFYLQPLAGGRILSARFWREFVEIENAVAIKVAPFNRYQTLNVMQAVAESGSPIAVYTGNDDNIVGDLLTPYSFPGDDGPRQVRMVGGLLGHWAAWTRSAVSLLNECHAAVANPKGIPPELLRKGVEVTDVNAAFFDAANQFAGSIAGIHEVLRRQGLFEGIWCLDPQETLGPGQKEEIDRVYAAYPHLNDDSFVREGLDEWLKP